MFVEYVSARWYEESSQRKLDKLLDCGCNEDYFWHVAITYKDFWLHQKLCKCTCKCKNAQITGSV